MPQYLYCSKAGIATTLILQQCIASARSCAVRPEDPQLVTVACTLLAIFVGTSLLVWWCRYCPSTSAAVSVNGTSGCSLFFLGRFYDNLSSKRRGVSSIGFPKPKLHLTLNDVVSPSTTCRQSWASSLNLVGHIVFVVAFVFLSRLSKMCLCLCL